MTAPACTKLEDILLQKPHDKVKKKCRSFPRAWGKSRAELQHRLLETATRGAAPASAVMEHSLSNKGLLSPQGNTDVTHGKDRLGLPLPCFQSPVSAGMSGCPAPPTCSRFPGTAGGLVERAHRGKKNEKQIMLSLAQPSHQL